MAYNDEVFESYLTAPDEQRAGIGKRLCKMEARTEMQAALKLLAVSRQADVVGYALAKQLEDFAKEELERLE